MPKERSPRPGNRPLVDGLTTVKLTIRVDEMTANRLERIAGDEPGGISAYVRALIERDLGAG